MKRFQNMIRICVLFVACGIVQSSFAQSLNEFFNNSEVPVVYLGIDFTRAKLINQPDANSFDIRNRYYGSINDLVVNEPKKFDISGAFHKSNVSSNLTAVKAKIDKINAEEIVSSNTSDFNRLTESDINSVVKGLSIDKRKGIGVLFVMEGMKKVDKSGMAAIWVTLIDMNTKKVLMTERFESKASGIGFRNYWGSTIRNTLDVIEKKKYKEWKERYGS